MNLADDQLKNYALHDFKRQLCKYCNSGSSLMNMCLDMCPNDIFIKDDHSKLIMEELNYDEDSLKAEML